MFKIFFLILLLVGPAAVANFEILPLVEGEKAKLVGRGPAWVENGNIVRVHDDGASWKVEAIHAGRSEVRIGNRQWQVQVLSRAGANTLGLLRPAVAKTMKLEIIASASGPQIRGRLLRWADWERLARACQNENCEYEMRAVIPAQLRPRIQTELSKKLREVAFFPHRLEFADRVQMHLPPHLAELDRIQNFLATYGISVIRDKTSIELQPLVKVQITVAEVKRSEFYKYGIQWPAGYTAQVLPASGDPTEPLTMSLQALEQTGLGRVLASPNLLCRSGKEAEFLAGGEFPIKIINFRTQDVIWKKYGILLRVKPVADESGRMSIAIETEISSIDPDRTVDGVPGLFTNRLQSHFDLSEPKTIALSGLIKRETGEASAGLPGLSRIPVLGALFASKDYRENRTELVVFVLPQVVHTEDFP